jgi:EAL domain-containing protein (putative c-di-GMP-specific phosphodiesterase class I)
MARKKLSFTSRYVLAFGLLMLLTNTLLGVIILYQSNTTVRSLINKNMLDVVKSAAGLLDGDTLAALTEKDVGGETYRDIEDRLIVFQNHEDIRFIYAVKQAGENRFVFTVDPDPDEPAAFGEEIVLTDALIQAGKGIPAVDSMTAADRWGNFYSAYCPVFDSSGKVAGIVGIDFDADWYNTTVRRHTISIAIITFLSVLIGGVLVFLITHNVRKRFRVLDAELNKLSSGMDQLIRDAGGNTADIPSDETESTDDEIEKLAARIRVMQKDMTVYERLQKDQYYNDSVTGIPNMIFVRQFADERVNMLRASQAQPAMFYFDIRSMVSYNTEYGYTKGDDLLRLTAHTLCAAFPGALVGRGEGDHFIVIDKYDERIDQKVRQINETIKKEAYGRSTGIQCAVVMMDNMTAAEGAQYARNTLKKIGDDLNVVCRHYSPEDDSENQISQYIIQHFDEAMQNGWIRVFYQPILETSTKKIANLEALARWIDPVRGVISPGQFIPVLSRYHLLHRLDLYMVEQICREFRLREEGGLSEIPVSVNFSARDFDYADIAGVLNRAAAQYDVPENMIIVEITEQDLALATDSFREQLLRIHESGYRLWLDDFGSGYSSLNVFGQYHIDRIKFDMELVRHLDDSSGANRIIMESITEMCRRMGIHTLAEGIETEEQYQFLRGIGCEMVQGFLFFRPEPLEKIISVIRKASETKE